MMKPHLLQDAMIALLVVPACWLGCLWGTAAVAQSPAAPTARPAPAAGQFDALVKSLDKNADGRITKEEAGGAPWFGRVDRNQDGVLDAAELDALRKARGGAIEKPNPTLNPTAAAKPYASPDGFTPDAPFVGEIRGGYGDPEFNDTVHQVVFQVHPGSSWVKA